MINNLNSPRPPTNVIPPKIGVTKKVKLEFKCDKK